MDKDQPPSVLIDSKKRASLFPHINEENGIFTFLVSELRTTTQVYTQV